nr:chromosomal replication initiator protein DnaA [Chloroflexaceae bacterium]
MNLTQIWQAALGTIQMQTPRHEFETWLKGTSLLALDSGTATVGTPSPFHKEGLENRYMGPVRRSLGDILGFPVQVRVVIAPGQMARPEAAPAVETTGKPAVAMHETPGTNGSLLPHMRPPTLRNGNGRLHEDERSDQQVVQLDLSSALRTGMLNPHYTFSRFIVG